MWLGKEVSRILNHLSIFMRPLRTWGHIVTETPCSASPRKMFSLLCFFTLYLETPRKKGKWDFLWVQGTPTDFHPKWGLSEWSRQLWRKVNIKQEPLKSLGGLMGREQLNRIPTIFERPPHREPTLGPDRKQWQQGSQTRLGTRVSAHVVFLRKQTVLGFVGFFFPPASVIVLVFM